MPKVYLNTGKVTERMRYDSVEISGRFIQVYDDLGKIYYSVRSACALHLIYWMSEKMGNYNQVILNKNNRSLFVSDVIMGGGKRYADGTVKSAIRTLVESGLITSMSEKGKRESTYFINPYHFWKTGSQKDRTESIKGYIYRIEENEKYRIRHRSQEETGGGSKET